MICISSLKNTYWIFLKTQSKEKTYSGNLHAAIVYVIARLFRKCQTPQSAQKFLLPKSAEHYLCHLKSNNITGQRKTTNKEKHFHPWLTSFNLKLSCTWVILINSKDLLQILYITVQTGWESNHARNKLIDWWW